jgi:hypothetical protein
MWRAGGILLLVLSQDLGPRLEVPAHEFAIRTPAGWVRLQPLGPEALRFSTGNKDAPAELTLTRYTTPNPTPLDSFVAQAKDHLAETFKQVKIEEEKVTLAGGPAARLSFVSGKILQVKTILKRTNLEYYLLDIALDRENALEARAVAERSIASFEIVRPPASEEELAAGEKTLAAIKDAKIDPELLGEHWQVILFKSKKIGHRRTKLSADGDRYAIEVDVLTDLGKDGRDRTVIRGTFSPDARFQKLETEQTKSNKGKRWQFRASAEIAGGKLTVERDMNGFREKASFAVKPGTVFPVVGDVLRRTLVGAGRGTYFLRTLSPFEDETGTELFEVGHRDTIRVDGVEHTGWIVVSKVKRRKNLTRSYAADRSLLKFGDNRNLLSVLKATQEEAEKPSAP